VVEPLRALIDSQVKELRKKGVNVESLLTLSDAASQRRQHAALRLNELAHQNDRSPLVLFSTPELICFCVDGVRSLVAKRLLSLIVIDEFDCIDESNDIYRRTYTEVVPKLKAATRSALLPFLFLSATASTALIPTFEKGLA
jgi:superfamily II DNA helicase RecQ